MAIGTQTIQFPFSGGIDEKTAAEYVDPQAKLIDAENAVFTHDGALEKRLGVQGLSTATPLGGSMGTPLKLATRGAEILAIDGAAAWSYSPGLSGWVNRGGVPYCEATRKHLYTNAAQTGQSSFSIAEGNGIRLIAWRTTAGSASAYLPGDVYVEIQDATTDAVLVNATAMTGGAIYYNPIVLIIGTHGYLFYSDNTGKIYGQLLTLSTLAWGGVTTIVSDANPTSSGIPGFIFDAVPYAPANTGILLAYPQANAGHFSAANARYLRLEALPALTISASATLTAYSAAWNTVTLISCRVDTSLNVAWVAWEYQQSIGGNNFQVQAQAFNATSWASLGSVFTMGFPLPFNGSKTAGQLSVEPYDATSALFVIAQGGARYDYTGGSHAQCTYSPPTYTTSPATGPPGLGRVASRPFRATVAGQTKWLVLFALFQEFQYNQEAQAVSYLLIDAIETGSGQGTGGNLVGVPVAVLAPRQGNYAYAYNAGTVDLRPPSVTNPCVTNATAYKALIGVNASEEFYSPPQVLNPPAGTCFIDLATFDFTGATSYQCAEGAGESFISGGVPSFYDGAAVQEIGFLQWPSSIVPTPSGAGGSLGTGTYEWVFVLASLDNAGLITRSTGWTFSTTFGGGTTNSCAFSVPFPAYTFHQNNGRNPVIEVYRTAANGTTLYYEGSINATVSMGPGSLSYTSTAADTSITSSALVYTTGGVLDAVNPPSLRCKISHVERLWGIDDTGYVIWYSTPFNQSDAPYFNEVLTLQFTDQPLTALASMDGNLIVFTANLIYYVAGTGPNNLGQGSDLQQAVLIPSDVGATDWRSIVRFPGGVLFQAPSGGIYMLGRDFSVSYIGKDVQDLTNGQAVVASGLTPTTNQLRFVLSNGIVLTFDYVLSRWARNVYAAGLGTMQAAIVVGTSWCAAASSGVVYQEKALTATAPWYDTTAGGANTWITLSATTADVNIAQLQGYQRSRHTMGYARWLEASDQQITLTFDRGVQTQSRTFTYGQLFEANPVAAEWDLHTMAFAGKAMSVQVTWSDAPPTGGTATTGHGALLLGLAFEVQVLDTRNRKIPAGSKG